MISTDISPRNEFTPWCKCGARTRVGQIGLGSPAEGSFAQPPPRFADKFLGEDRIEWKWGGYQGGKPADGHKVALTLIRKK
jgi:hypothetical protein